MAELTTEDKKVQAIRALDIIKSLMRRGVGDPTLLLKSALNIIEGSGLGLEYTDELFFAFHEGMKIYQVIQSIKDAALTNDVEHLNSIKNEVLKDLKQFKKNYAQTYINAGLIDEILKDPNSKEAKIHGTKLIENYKNTEANKERISNGAQDLKGLKDTKEKLVVKHNELEKHPHKHLPHVSNLLSDIKEGIVHITHEITEAEKSFVKDVKGFIAHEKVKERMGENPNAEEFLESFIGQLDIEISSGINDKDLSKYVGELKLSSIISNPYMDTVFEDKRVDKETINIQQSTSAPPNEKTFNTKKMQLEDNEQRDKLNNEKPLNNSKVIDQNDLIEAHNIISKYQEHDSLIANKEDKFTSKENERRSKEAHNNISKYQKHDNLIANKEDKFTSKESERRSKEENNNINR
ncbi:hypothetical protein I862_04190 [endosymbiont of Acanthamoeba sp. UWC8]|uniref:hypothetical protein n=1 Tax=endosymbiont of Acanthamoeba sp. UWC8 TaxID=86106 RepID=UPI0004D18ACB|nr:hypothetical protein [endosymbiont of Acanthamoeba sp. UWC8]AIF81398.1 hypothetical protein I862_04190 [endosymbiont of Acanthamoeba sp. UWC8]